MTTSALIARDDELNRLLTLRNKTDLRIIAMGDSSVFGVGDYGDNLPAVGAGWAGRFAHDIGAKKFVNVAKNGARARDLAKHQLLAALSMKPDIALVCIGTNDVLRGDFSPTEMKVALCALVRELTESGIFVAFLGLPDPIVTAPGPMALRKILHPRVKVVNQILYDVSVLFNVSLVKTWNLPYERKHWHVDRMHPSPIGHQNIADLFRKELKFQRVKVPKLPTQNNDSQYFQIYWLLTNGLKWFLKRSVDLVPGLIWLLISELIRQKKHTY